MAFGEPEDDEPLGYQHFLCDVNIEYNPGGSNTLACANKQSFKLKYLPYMVVQSSQNPIDNTNQQCRSISANLDARQSNNRSEILQHNQSLSSRSSNPRSHDNSYSNNSLDCDQQINTSGSSTSFTNSNQNTNKINSKRKSSSDVTSAASDSPPSRQASQSTNGIQADDATDNSLDSIRLDSEWFVDVTQTSCAFLGNYDYVPQLGLNEQRRVVLELISAKLSSTNPTNNVLPIHTSSSHTSLHSLGASSTYHDHPDDYPNNHHQLPPVDGSSFRTVGPPTTPVSTRRRGNSQIHTISLHHGSPSASDMIPPSTTSSGVTSSGPSSSKRYVNYTLLIKTIPGLDRQPAVIERRFSDFLLLYQGLKANEQFDRVLDKNINFPKKVLMGNFSLANIAFRSVEFTRLLQLCMGSSELLWSGPFVSFLLDKELKDAHRLSLRGDPDDVQAIIETAFFIERKLFLNDIIGTKWSLGTHCSSQADTSLSNSNLYSPMTTIRDDPIETSHRPDSSPLDADRASSVSLNLNGTSVSGHPGELSEDQAQQSASNSVVNKSSPALNQRILVTFCLLFVTYQRGGCLRELRDAVHLFEELLACQPFVESLMAGRHYSNLRACLLFLMNITSELVITDGQRTSLKRRLEDIDGAHADMNELQVSTGNRTLPASSGPTGRRVTRGDLATLVSHKSFCMFQEHELAGQVSRREDKL